MENTGSWTRSLKWKIYELLYRESTIFDADRESKTGDADSSDAARWIESI
jgi:hypothetical protein